MNAIIIPVRVLVTVQVLASCLPGDSGFLCNTGHTTDGTEIAPTVASAPTAANWGSGDAVSSSLWKLVIVAVLKQKKCTL